ncbi:MAG: long-chain-fatty-acid--CoA ligase [Gemmatimonadota bacterium]
MRLHDYFDWGVRERPTQPLAVQGDRSLSYGDAGRRVRQLANALRGAGLEPGDRFGYLAKNSIDMVVAYLAGSKAELVMVPLNYRLAPPEWEYIVRDAGCRIVFAQEGLADQIDDVRLACGPSVRWIALGTPRTGWVGFDEWLAGVPAGTSPRPVLADPDLYLMYTSGTTGRPKGAVLTHGTILTNVAQNRVTCRTAWTAGERALVVMPMFHAGAASLVFSGIVHNGTLVIHEDFDPERVVGSLERDDIGLANFVPAMIQACLLEVPELDRRTFPKLRTIFYGASPIAEEVLRRAMAAFRCDFYQAYGLTEASVVLTMLTAEDHERALGGAPELLRSAGRPVPGTEIRIVDAEGRDCPLGEPGLVMARGPQMMRGYWANEAATRSALAGGWLRTGDIGALDAEGYLFLHDRANDTIVTGGENVYPCEVESALFDHPAVADAAVIGIPDDRLGEAVHAVVVLRAGAAGGADELIAHCRTRIGGYKIPRTVEIVAELPRNSTGKVLKRVLREPYWAGQARRVS